MRLEWWLETILLSIYIYFIEYKFFSDLCCFIMFPLINFAKLYINVI